MLSQQFSFHAWTIWSADKTPMHKRTYAETRIYIHISAYMSVSLSVVPLNSTSTESTDQVKTDTPIKHLHTFEQFDKLRLFLSYLSCDEKDVISGNGNGCIQRQ